MGWKLSCKWTAEGTVKGFSEYSAALGVPCSKCTELQSNSYADKQLEICAALAVSDIGKTKALELAEPADGDMIFILGAKTGADGALDKNTEAEKEKRSFGAHGGVFGGRAR